MTPFTPKRWLSNGHAMTVYAWARQREFATLPGPEARLVSVADDSKVLAHCYWQPQRAGRPTLLALHGLEGSSSSHYMRGLAERAFHRGWNAVLLNQRNCGGTERLSPGLYHSGLTSDPRAVLRSMVKTDRIGPAAIVGYSLGGNLAVKLAGEFGDAPDVPVAGVVAVSPTIDLDLCVRAIDRHRNFVYHWNFVRNLKARLRRKEAAWPGTFNLAPLGRIWTIRAFDEAYTAPLHGFKDAGDYYFRASALRIAARVKVPLLILTAADDPFVPPSQFDDPAVRDNPNITVHAARHGGHCGFVGRGHDGKDLYWAEATAIEFLMETESLQTPSRIPAPSLLPRA